MSSIFDGKVVNEATREGILSPLNDLIATALLETTEVRCQACQGKFEFVLGKARRVLRNVQNLLDTLFGFQDRTSTSDSHRTFCLRDMVDDLTQEFGHLIRDRNLEFVSFIEEDIEGLFYGSFQLIYRALGCLLENSIRFTPPGGGLILIIQKEPQSRDSLVRLAFTLCDSGAGIPQEVRHRVMQPFGKASETRSGRSGMGLGLSVAAEVIGRIGGAIELTTKVGQGTRVRFWVNCIQQTENEQETTSHSQYALVVDDVPVNRMVLVRMLELHGWEVDQASNGQEAVEAVKRKPYDIIFMDINMPIMNGFDARDVIEMLEADLGRKTATQIVAHTTADDKEARKEFIERGFMDFLPKPFSKTLLLSILRDLQLKD